MMQNQQRLPLTSWEHLFVDVTKEDDRYASLHAYLNTCVRPGERVIIFRSHGPKAVKVALTLRSLEHNAAPVVGRMSESDRRKTVQLFIDGTLPILVSTELAFSSGNNNNNIIPRADHVINWGFHWSSPAQNAKEYIARCDKGNGRVVSFVTIADSVTLQHLNTALSFHMKEVQLDETQKKEAMDRLNETNSATRQEFVRSREQDKLNAFLLSQQQHHQHQASSSSLNTTTTSTSSASLSSPSGMMIPSNNNNNNSNMKGSSSSFSSSNNNNNNNQLPSRHYVPPTPGEAIKNINQVMQQYQAIHNNNSSNNQNDNDDDDDFDTSSEDDEDSSDSDFDDDDNQSSNDSKSGGADKKKKNNKKSQKRKSVSIISRGAVAANNNNNMISPLRTRTSTASPLNQDNHGLHGHVSLPKYSTNRSSSTGGSSMMRSPQQQNRQASRSRSRPRAQQHQNQRGASSNNMCLPRQIDDAGNFVHNNNKNNVGPFVAHPGDEQLVEMIEADMNLGHLTTKFDDIAGQEEAKRLLEEAVIFPTMMPNFFTDIRRPWKGVLLFGPPGTGKTLLAKAVAAASKTTFFAVSPASIVSKWRGESEKLIRVLFEMARHYAPSTIFIDEVDSLCGDRGSGGEHEASRRAKSMLLQEMDGITVDPTKTVVVLGATNHPAYLDTGFLRRFEQRIYIPLPTRSDCESLFKLNTKKILLGEDVNVSELASLLEGKMYSGADVTTLIRDAAMRPMRRFFYGDGENSSSENKNETNARRQELYRNPQLLEEKLAKLPVLKSDFEASIKHIPSSVNRDQVKGYEEWQRKFSQSEVGFLPDKVIRKAGSVW